MSQDHSAVLLGAADSHIVDSGRAHDIVNGVVDQGSEDIREATQAIEATSLNLELSNMEGTLPSSHNLDNKQTFLQDSSHDILPTKNGDEPCVTTTAHDAAGVFNGTHEPDQGKSPSECPGMYTTTSLEYNCTTIY